MRPLEEENACRPRRYQCLSKSLVYGIFLLNTPSIKFRNQIKQPPKSPRRHFLPSPHLSCRPVPADGEFPNVFSSLETLPISRGNSAKRFLLPAVPNYCPFYTFFNKIVEQGSCCCLVGVQACRAGWRPVTQSSPTARPWGRRWSSTAPGWTTARRWRRRSSTPPRTRRAPRPLRAPPERAAHAARLLPGERPRLHLLPRHSPKLLYSQPFFPPLLHFCAGFLRLEYPLPILLVPDLGWIDGSTLDIDTSVLLHGPTYHESRT